VQKGEKSAARIWYQRHARRQDVPRKQNIL
jgi:hypothetical protein